MKRASNTYCMTLLALSIGVSLMIPGCQLMDSTSLAPTLPTNDAEALFNGAYGQEEGERFAYEASEVPGITITADFAIRHISGKPWGEWIVNATWRNEDRHAIAEVTVPVTIDERGIGTALLPSDFLDSVFQAAHDRYIATQDQDWPDVSVWFHRPGLYLNYFPVDEEAWHYYTFE